MEVVIYTKRDCPLCDEAKAVIERHRAVWGFSVAEVDIASDPALDERFRHEVPAVYVDGEKRFVGHVNEVLFRRLLYASPPREA